ncbi:hypothetical protein BKA65DRAFT_171786 [Rhexocercosporidium sp. MPI-PUGE-AT-0058]|nr:hypothetical protein BKA65DRAFT_171786 [Rhexocercosporidium sp. MPI-PUGE-AT-0058]
MSGVGEASLVLGIISSIIAIVTAAKNIYDAANDTSGLPKAFHKVAAKLPIVVVILTQANEYIHHSQVDQSTRDAFKIILYRCEASSKELHEIFARVVPKDGASRVERYISAARKIGQGGRVEDLIAEILKEIGLLLTSSSFATQKTLQTFEGALADISLIEPSLPANFTTISSPKVKVLRQIQYNDNSIHQNSVHPQAMLRGWLLSDSLSDPDFTATEQDTCLQKRFCNPDTGYNSCQWFFETLQYKNFIEASTSKVLRVKGSPGCGKSILTASIIHNLETLNTGSNSTKVLYYYCSRDPEQTSSMTLIRRLLAQSLEWATPEMILDIKKFHSAHPILKVHGADNNEEGGLWRLLRKLLGMRTQKTYIVVDALDDCAQPLICLRNLIKVTTALAAEAQCGLLLSSRLERRDDFNNKAIQSSMVKNGVECCQLDITPELTRRDVTEFVTYQVSTRPSFISSSQLVRDKIIASVCHRANGMFLYASLALEDLKGETISSIAGIDITLANLPSDLYNSYERKLQLPQRTRRGPESIRWIFCANPSLTWQELKSALAIGEGGFNESEVILDSCDSFIDHSCGQLVEAFGDSERLRFIHPTVIDFLVNSLDSENNFDVLKADSMVASKLLTFLEYPDLPSFSSPITQPPEVTIREYTARTGRGLYSFAILNWHVYLKKCDKSQNSELEVQVQQFLESKYFIRWLKTAIIMSRIFRNGQDSASLTADVVDSLQSWISGRSWSFGDSELKIQSWIKDFLDMMLDWGKVIETQPDWIHYLHLQLLPSASCFRNIIEGSDSDQSIIQFDPHSIKTRHTDPITWPERCITMDLEKDLAFTYDEPFICCYHIKTGMMTAEILVPIPPKVRGPLAVRRGVLSSSGKYLAVLFEAMGPSTDPIGNKIRAGRRLQLNMATTGYKWGLDDASMAFDLSGILAQMAVGVDAAEFVVCLLEVNHAGPARTHLFSLPSWVTSPVLVTGSQIMRWDLDDVDILQFSADSSKLFTAFGTFDLESGANEKQWQFALGQLYQGGKVTEDCKSFVTILRDIDGDCIVQFYDANNGSTSHREIPCRETRFSGVIHLLAVSNHGRFLLLTQREIVQDARKSKSRKVSLPAQQASIGVWDCRDGEWTPLLLLDRELVNRLPQWNFSPYNFPPCFGPEALIEGELNSVYLSVPARWKLSGNVRKTKPLNSEETSLLLFEAKRSLKGFGKNPSLKLQLPATTFRYKW